MPMPTNFHPDVGELAFLADEKRPLPYTRGFLLAEEQNIRAAGPGKPTLIIKGKADHINHERLPRRSGQSPVPAMGVSAVPGDT